MTIKATALRSDLDGSALPTDWMKPGGATTAEPIMPSSGNCAVMAWAILSGGILAGFASFKATEVA